MAGDDDVAGGGGDGAPGNLDLQNKVRDLEGSLKRSNELMERMHAEMQTLRQNDREIYVAPQSEVTRFKERPKTSGDITAEEWVTEVKMELDCRKSWSETKKADFILRKLGGPARKEILARGPNVRKSAEQIIDIILNVFGEEKEVGKLQERLFNIRQEDGESLLQLSLRILDIVERLESTTLGGQKSELLKERFCAAVRDTTLKREIRRLIREQPALSFFDLRAQAIEFVGDHEKPRGKVVASSETASSAISDTLEHLMRQVKELSVGQQKLSSDLTAMKSEAKGKTQGERKPPRRNEAGELICYKCQKPGHIAINCQPSALN